MLTYLTVFSRHSFFCRRYDKYVNTRMADTDTYGWQYEVSCVIDCGYKKKEISDIFA